MGLFLQNKRIAFTSEEAEFQPDMDPSENVSNWLEKNALSPVVTEPDPSGSDENPSSPKPSTPPIFAEDDPNPEATRGKKSSSFIAD
ncbi:hypothetical protein NPIL_264681 [Nephila pilipes]|uniref:Uncharacterized protein n=1 Tax=Nephila pilipes TaxID=299642 RepID=A0A8X6TXQ2_NEPPI|nr:hypothetical protein NPIL_264681 [Nephila pilipes]